MGVLENLVKDYEKIVSERDSAEMRFFKYSNEASEIKIVLRKVHESIANLDEQTKKAKEGVIRPVFWNAIENVLTLDAEIKELLEPPEE